MKRAMVFILILVFFFLQSGCEEGLYENDAQPDNLVIADPQLRHDEPADPTEGSVVFWTTPTQKFETILVTVLKLDSRYQKSNAITSSWLIKGGPDCDECKGCAHFDLPVGMYSYDVEGGYGHDINTRGETFEVTAQGCEKVFVPRRNVESEPPDHESQGRN